MATVLPNSRINRTGLCLGELRVEAGGLRVPLRLGPLLRVRGARLQRPLPLPVSVQESAVSKFNSHTQYPL